jgi:quinol monooxygenase YgiN
MSVPVLIGFTGVLVAAVATGVLAGRCVNQPRIYLILWTASTLGLAVALAAQSMGFASGFGLATFRAVQLPTQLCVPLWLAWGLVELVVESEAARFGMRLVSSALTVVTAVIVGTDPLTAAPSGKSWPSGGTHFQPVSHYALDAVQAVAALAVLASLALAVARARKDPLSRPDLTGIFPVGLAVLAAVGLRLPWPDRSAYPLLSLLAAALIWFGATRVQRSPDRQYLLEEVLAADGVPGRVPDGVPDGVPDRVPAGPYAAYDQPRAAEPRAPAEPRVKAAGASAAAAAGAPAKPYGRILIFTLLEDRVGDFDRLAEHTAEQVRTGEPGTLVYVIHLVPNAPLQRIFYEIYRDPAAFDSHDSQPYMQRFVAERRSCVLATNVIELRLKYAKIAPLPNSQPAGPAPPGLPPLPPSGWPDRPSPLPSPGRGYRGA